MLEWLKTWAPFGRAVHVQQLILPDGTHLADVGAILDALAAVRKNTFQSSAVSTFHLRK